MLSTPHVWGNTTLAFTMEYEKCYVFQPDDERPTKRRRTEPEGLQASWMVRRKAYQEAWKARQDNIDQRLGRMNTETVSEIVSFLDQPAPDGRIPTALILAGPNSALRSSIVAQIQSHGDFASRISFVSISSAAGTNLKGALKTVIQKATACSPGDDEDDEVEPAAGRKGGPKLLNYDLQILHDYVVDHHIRQVVVAIEDTEAFDGDLLSELIELFGCWHDRIPFALLLNIGTSVDFLQQRLSRGALKYLHGAVFDAAASSDEVEQIFEALTDPGTPLWMGSGLASMALERQADYIQSIDSLVQTAQYAYMSHYYANALSLFLDVDISQTDVPKDHFEALRNLPSFRTFARKLLDDDEVKILRGLLDSDQSLLSFVRQSVANGRDSLARSNQAIEVIRILQASLPNSVPTAKSKLYVQAMSGKLAGSPLLRTLLLTLRKAPSDVALPVIANLKQSSSDVSMKSAELSEIESELVQLLESKAASGQPLRSEDDIKNSTLRTTVIAQKVELSKQKSTLSKQDAAYTTLIRRLSDLLSSHFEKNLRDPKDLVLHEIFIYDLKSPYREVFTPRPRAAIERALTAPHDYLDCDCCDPEQDEATLAATQPATAVLYQLYLESGSLINASDLWQAFAAVMGESQDDEHATMALFQRALADMKYLGLVKNTRKRVDHVAKVAWRGL
ncbi:Origin recognition complex subunit 3 [Fulvia fulva]|uniref:Origin recognition complex subunit 3 n=1 Tax=Passalora fulva TaxID=5499 RepID=A0A9Q8P6U3_PASFU|nr:Origin recognition complex subunit 3 [Fulvia fulva]KAK4629144.1 Origin recognition complex subunit 3 [Fulvia fulva]KAK4630096.1 Origin recognition complex subunit 3 [Fulvia fulva]UJO15197.1 Origin recognition complex subunit 3 [Fulvia fulva]WPV12821.1 Origin recognition complex subunit 3 [Fulvia fulva]WPV28004.1 Origin recognition complex subunit 3 [Fulvia fulva]